MKSKLPIGWRWGTIADIYDAVKTTVHPSGTETVPYIGLEHLCKGGGIDSVGNSENLQSIKTVFQADDILYGKLRPYLNKHAVVDFSGVCSTDIIVFRSRCGYPSRLLDLYLSLPSVIKHANEHSKGINLPRVSAGVLLAMPMPIPPLDEAMRLISQLDAVMQRLEASQERLDNLPALLKRFRQAVLAAAVSGKLTEAWRAQQPEGGETAFDLLNSIRASRRAEWEEKQRSKMTSKQLSLDDSWKQAYLDPYQKEDLDTTGLPEGWLNSDVASLAQVVRGASPRPAGDPRYFGGDIPWITVGELTKDDKMYLYAVSNFVTPEGKENSRYIEPGTLLLTNSGATLGVPKITTIGGCINDGSVALLGVSDELKKYLYIVLKGMTQQLRQLNQGAAQPNLNTDIVRAISVPLPPVAEQKKIVRQVVHYFELADQLEARFEQAASLVEQLPQALLAKAFSGQLVPQDPSDEPASVLLERLARGTPALAKGKRGLKKVESQPLLFS